MRMKDSKRKKTDIFASTEIFNTYSKICKKSIYENWVMSVDVIHGHAMTLSTMSSTIYEKEFLDAQLTFKDYNGPG